MDTRQGNIISPELMKIFAEQKPKEARFMKLIPEELLPELKGMNRKQRREYYRTHKKEFI